MDLIKIIIILLIGVFIGYHNSYITVILNCPQTISRIINTLTRQTARWSNASNQYKRYRNSSTN